ncbi:hypothetical protein F3Y22_tig00110940pilonHSYRG00538 [Hibiscus syriacus]|uniref:Uncharacterized protein n=1 Tax=Hibiscus syriacus TaxID=106335 RepID=A0A6A2ZD54_HIBSY|nr:hypothetical protein F3Y22_tig00110940pilonHSYRG00538 [Hibiscus syriacus]
MFLHEGFRFLDASQSLILLTFNKLDRIPDFEEIKDAHFDMSPLKSPVDIEPALNRTSIVHIPKVPNPTSFKDFQPISLLQPGSSFPRAQELIQWKPAGFCWVTLNIDGSVSASTSASYAGGLSESLW